MGTMFSIPRQPTAGQIKTPVQCVENPAGSGGVIICDQMLFTMNKKCLEAVHDHRGEKRHQTSSVVMAGEDKKEKCLTRP
ncbi:hypothetical protein QQF64_017234 [Cirrhinus molitorella]|uniref:Uncharacterized protein n=2 Tax=Cirrhinus molitorella TaxID=172907 RepID=A0ABR3LKG8_9TELE|nr:hypothetical protein Q8A67_022928 [Cirrhinus molitorella]